MLCSSHSSIACTAVITEVSYHDESVIRGEVEFLSETEWREELGILLRDLVNHDGAQTPGTGDLTEQFGLLKV
jgi:hypothetical protein